jgi:ferredoxin-nitrate reductase
MGFSQGMRYTSSADIFDEFARSTAGRPDDQSALYHELLRQKGPQQWPFPSMGKPTERRYASGTFPTPTGKAQFWARPHEIAAERTDAEFPLVLTTGRVRSQWHTRTKTALVKQLNAQDGEPYVSVNPADARTLALLDAQRVRVRSRRGSAVTTLRVDASVPPGVAFMPIHWNELFAPGASPNEATSDDTDPISKQPSLKACAVRIERIECENDASPDASSGLVPQMS